jgi:hypothetical protein
MVPDDILATLWRIVGHVENGKTCIDGEPKVPDWLYKIVLEPSKCDFIEFGVEVLGSGRSVAWREGGVKHEASFRVSKRPPVKVVPQHVQSAMDSIKWGKQGTGLGGEETENGRWIVIDHMGDIQRFDERERAFQAAEHCNMESDDYYNFPVCVVHDGTIWDRDEIHEVYAALAKREGWEEWPW